jgi:hypothetical protein
LVFLDECTKSLKVSVSVTSKTHPNRSPEEEKQWRAPRKARDIGTTHNNNTQILMSGKNHQSFLNDHPEKKDIL